MEHLLLLILVVTLIGVFGLLYYATKPVANTAEKTEPPPCQHKGNITQFFENLTLRDGRTVQVAISSCPSCVQVLPPQTDTFWKLPYDTRARLCEYYENQGLDASVLHAPPGLEEDTL